MKTLLDMDIWSEIMRAKNAEVTSRASTYLSQHGRFTLSTVTVFEVVRGLQKANRQNRIDEFDEMLDDIEVLDLDRSAADLAGRIYGELDRRGTKIDFGDALIAGIALRHRVRLATGNAAHFSRVQSLGYPLLLDDWRSPGR
jgi:predicted nucleic acid-binding protein